MNISLRSAKGISTLSLLILLLVSGIVGAVLSYLWTVGYYVDKEWKVPEGTSITITNITFPIEDCEYFTVTVLNPSYSKADAYITGIAIIATSNDVETIYSIPAASTDPQISNPYPLEKGKTVTFKCERNWGEFAGQTIRVVVFLQNDSGATFPFTTSEVELEIVKIEFDISVTVERFNVTIRNSADSFISLNLTEILFDYSSIPYENITTHDENATLPQQLQSGQNKTFICAWNLLKTGALGSSHTITARSLQGYSATYKTETLPQSALLNITDVAFNASDTGGFNVSVARLDSSPYNITVSRVTITNGTQIFENITIISDIILRPNSTISIRCLWNWEAFKDQEVRIMVHTTQGFFIDKFKTFPEG